MRVWDEKKTYILPDENRIIYKDNEYIHSLFKRLKEYTSSKRTNINILDNDGDKISSKDLIYIPVDNISLVKQYLSMTAKSIYKQYLINTIADNDKMFISIYEALDLLQAAFTDSGFAKLKSILFRGVKSQIEFYQDKINVMMIVDLFELNIEKLTDTELCIVYLNMLLKMHQGKRIIINVNKIQLDKDFLDWHLGVSENMQLFISNNIIHEVAIFKEFSFDILLLKNQDEIEYLEMNKSYFHTFLFALLPVVMVNLQYLAKKIININQFYYESNQNILITFDTNTLKSDFT